MVKKTDIVIIEEYDSNWEKQFETLKLMINNYIGNFILEIQHVGSTSIDGLSAKPIIDIDIVIESTKDLPKIIHELEQKDYIYQGDLGVKDRYAFQRIYDEDIKYHLYVCPKDGIGYKEHILFRDYLRSNFEARDNYMKLKKELAKKFERDSESYCNGKTKFIQKILKIQGGI
ncbi:GrpB family protein [Cetobacterium sp.]|uniref:GrpB family protein n=1 Tax=Cetobacterium sp. TaxID=2071632 RepID=UPI0025BA8B5C|nr:GrpB family protein [Cetobacterium sp.]